MAWAAAELRDALRSRSVTAEIFPSLVLAPSGFDCVLAATGSSDAGQVALAAAKMSLPPGPEAIGLAHCSVDKHRFLLACGSDIRGLVYALLELADRVNLRRRPDR